MFDIEFQLEEKEEYKQMGISLKAQKMLWGRAANRCAFPDCSQELVIESIETNAASFIGEVCHIIAKEPSGPRRTPSLQSEELDEYSNLILLCRNHHKMVDDQPDIYTIQCLRDMKKTHEEWVRKSLNQFDAAKQYDEEIYAAYTEEWVKRCDLDNWKAWSSHVLGGGQPQMSYSRDKELEELREWLFSRIWPGRYIELEAAYKNFLHVLIDFQNIFRRHAKEVGINRELLLTEKIYQIDDWDPPRYERLSREYDFHVALVEDLILELTRAANYVCDRVRQFLWPTFRLQEGLILVISGPYMDLTFKLYKVEYRERERELFPYHGLDCFKKERKNRDVHFGEGSSGDDPEFWVGGN